MALSCRGRGLSGSHVRRFRWCARFSNTERAACATFVPGGGALLLFAVIICEMLPAIRRQAGWATRVGFYFCAVVIYDVSVSGVASAEMESTLRYKICVHGIIVLAIMQSLHQIRIPPLWVRA